MNNGRKTGHQRNSNCGRIADVRSHSVGGADQPSGEERHSFQAGTAGRNHKSAGVIKKIKCMR